MRALRIAVISDLHVGREARAKDMCPYADDISTVDTQYRKRFTDLIERNSLSADYLILPGDVTHTANPSEVELASEVITEAISALKVPGDRVFFVPGNHDVDWEVLKVGPHKLRWEQRYDPLKIPSCIFKTLMESAAGHLLDDPYLSCWEKGDLVVAGFNSSWHDNQSELLHHGRIEDSHLDRLSTILSSVDKSPEKLRVFLVHHHPVQYSSPVPGEADFSQMVNSEKLLDLLTHHRFDLILHGHTHQPRFRIHVLDAGHPLAILAAGSFSLALPRDWMGKVNNQFHVLEISGRCPISKCIQGSLKSWTYYCPHGWIPSLQERDGISHLEPFGTYWSPVQLEVAMRRDLASVFTDEPYIDLELLLTAMPDLRFMRPDRVIDVLDKLAPEFNLRIHERRLDRLIIVKERT